MDIDHDRIATIADPIERAKAARSAQVQLQVAYEDERTELMAITGAAIREARQGGMSFAKIAVALDVTPGRVQQLEKA